MSPLHNLLDLTAKHTYYLYSGKLLYIKLPLVLQMVAVSLVVDIQKFHLKDQFWLGTDS
jgi:hypothetical protein